VPAALPAVQGLSARERTLAREGAPAQPYGMRTLLLVTLFTASAHAEPVHLLQFDVAGDAAAVAAPLARRLQAHGAHGDLVRDGQRLWLVASRPPAAVAEAMAPGRLRFAPVVSEGVAPPPPGAEVLPAEGDAQRYGVDLSRAIAPTLVEVKANTNFEGLPVVEARFDAAGGEAFHALTRALVDRKLAIVLDGRVMSAPVVREAIPGGRVMIMLGSRARAEDAERLAARLRTGPLPSAVTLVSQAQAARVDADGRTTVTGAGAPLRYPTPKRWHPVACSVSGQPDCAVALAQAAPR
jgi:hypothetical protein